MAQRIDTYAENDAYRESLTDVTKTLNEVDLANPTNNIVPEQSSMMDLLKLQAQVQSQTIGEAIEFMRTILPLQEQTDTIQLLAANAGDKVSVQQQQTYLENLAKKNYLVTRMVQKRQTEQDAKANGSYFDVKREPICTIPVEIATGDVTHVSDSALKLLVSFKGDTDMEAENLKSFMRSVYDVAITNRLKESCVKAILKRKLQSTARRLIDSYEQEFTDDPERPSLREVVLKFEDRFMSEWQPEIASAKLSMYTKAPNQTYQTLEGEIAELTSLAARGEPLANRTQWMKQKKIAVFKQAINEDDRQLIYRENQSRSITGLAEMNLSQMVDYLIKIYSEQNAFTTANHLKNSPKRNDTESLQAVYEKKPKYPKAAKKEKKEQALIKKAAEDQKIKDDLFAVYEQQNRTFNSNEGRGRGGKFKKYPNTGNRNQQGSSGNGKNYNPSGNNPNGFNNQNGFKNQNGFNPNGNQRNQRGGNAWNGNNGNKQYKPRKFVTPDMVNVSPNSCLKCNSPTHRFQEQSKCIYGSGNLMTKACFNCREGGHHHTICIKNQKPTVGAPEAQNQQAQDQQFSKWPELTKTVPEIDKFYSQYGQSKNDWIPSLFPQN